jgi:RNA polymerase sigma-70 factor (ECF subfamily)
MQEIHKDIILSAQSGDRMAYKKLYNLYAKSMYNICFRMTERYEIAEDVLQESFLDVFQNIGKFDFRVTFGAWVKRIVINNCINELKKKSSNLTFLEEINIDIEETIEDEQHEPTLTIEKVTKAMMKIPEGTRTIFSLYLLEGYDHEEIAEILKISVSTSKTQYMKAKQRIKTIIIENEQN